MLSAFSIASCGQQGGKKNSYINADNETFDKLIQAENAQVIDVRTPQEFAQGFIPNATNMNVNGSEFASQAETLDKKQPVYVYCRSGGRSVTASKKLKAMGFEKVYNLEGGIMSWQGAGYEVKNP